MKGGNFAACALQAAFAFWKISSARGSEVGRATVRARRRRNAASALLAKTARESVHGGETPAIKRATISSEFTLSVIVR